MEKRKKKWDRPNLKEISSIKRTAGQQNQTLSETGQAPFNTRNKNKPS